MVIFLDTYAIIEIDLGNRNYKEYALESIKTMTTVFNLVEAYFVYYKRFGEKEANRLNRNVKQIVIPIDDSIIKGAVKFKLTHSKRRFSFADAIGYVTARKYNAKFLTGDYMFKGIEGVEFVK